MAARYSHCGKQIFYEGTHVADAVTEESADRLVTLLNTAAAVEREACIATLERLDRTGREWVWDSLWSNIFRDGIAALRRRGQ